MAPPRATFALIALCLALCLATLARVAPVAEGLVPEVEARCPGACGGRSRGLCTRVGCSCLAGFAGVDCTATRGDRGDDWPRGRPSGVSRTVCVASAQVPHASLADEVAFAVPGFRLARDLAARGYLVTLVFLALNGGPDRETLDAWRADVSGVHNIELEVLSKTQHYYMPSTASQSYELYSFIRERAALRGKRPFDLIVVHDGHGLGYYLGLAKRQDERRSGLEGTRLAVNLAAPHLWLISEGAGIGVTSVDDIEIDFMEKEAVRLADFVYLQHKLMHRWCSDRMWRFPGRTRVGRWPHQHHNSRISLEGSTAARRMPESWPSLELGIQGEKQGGSVHRKEHLVIIMQGPGGGQQGEMISSGGNRRSSAHFKVSEQYKFDMMEQDIDTLGELAKKLGWDLSKRPGVNLTTFTVLVAGLEDRSLPLQLKRRISGVEAELRSWWPGLSFVLRACKYSEAIHTVRGADDGTIFAVLANYHRDSLTLEWLHSILAAEQDSLYLSRSNLTRGILDDSMEGRLVGRAGHGILSATVDDLVLRLGQSFQGDVFRGADHEGIRIGMQLPLSSSSSLDDLGALSVGGNELPAKLQEFLAAQTSIGILKALTGNSRTMRASSPGIEEFLHSSQLPFVTVVITHYNRPEFLEQAIKSITFQSYPEDLLELIIIDDGSPDMGVREKLLALSKKHLFEVRGWKVLFEPNRYLGGARNAGAQRSKGKYILFMDDDNYAKSYEVEHFVRAMERTHADILTSGLDFITGMGEPESDACFPVKLAGAPETGTLKCLHRELKVRLAGDRSEEEGKRNGTKTSLVGRASPSFVFLGASSNVGLFKNCYGDANSFFRSESFRELGGYTTDKHVGYEDWELYSKAALGGYNLQTVPRAMYFYRFTSGSMQKTTSYRQSRKRALRAYTSRL